MKPIRLTEFGCAAVDRGGNAPNLFQDPKSAENALPPDSTGERDDRMQRRALAAVLGHYADEANNPVSAVYGGRMLAGADAWCWDARPWPAFPGRADVWADAGAWRTGHWLNGRLSGETRDLIAALLKRGGLGEDDYEIGAFDGEVQGYVVDRPMRTRDALEPLLAALGLVAAERGGRIAVTGEGPVDLTLRREAMALPDSGDSVKAERRLDAAPGTARLRFIDGHDGYQTGSVVVRGPGDDGGIDLDLPAVCSTALARAAAVRALEGVGAERLTVAVGPLEALRLEPADAVEVEGRDGVWRVARVDLDETPSVLLEPVLSVRIGEDEDGPTPDEAVGAVGVPFLRIMELPLLPGAETDERPFAVVAAEPWRAMRVFAGADETALTARADVAQPADVGQLVEPLGAGPSYRWDEVNALVVRVEGRAPENRSITAVLGGANTVAVETARGWELVQFREAVLAGDDVWRLSGLLRGQQGTEGTMGAEAGGVCVFLGPDLERAESPRAERGLPLLWRAGPLGGPAGGAETAEIVHVVSGVATRPWRPVHLSVENEGEGRRVRWRARSRIDGDRWDGEATGADPLRFRVRVMTGEAVLRQIEVEGLDWLYPAADLAADFIGGPGADAVVEVAQWGEGYGWGAEATVRLS